MGPILDQKTHPDKFQEAETAPRLFSDHHGTGRGVSDRKTAGKPQALGDRPASLQGTPGQRGLKDVRERDRPGSVLAGPFQLGRLGQGTPSWGCIGFLSWEMGVLPHLQEQG